MSELKAASFDVCVLTRQNSSQAAGNHSDLHDTPLKFVDYTSIDSLTHALNGANALVSALNASQASLQQQLIDAAIKARVKLFIPSEFGCDPTHPLTSQLPAFPGKAIVRQLLLRKVEKGMIAWTSIICGPFFDLGT